jgi:hypothetical protein
MALWQLRRRLRTYWTSQPEHLSETLAAQFDLSAEVLLARVRRAATFGKLWDWVLKKGLAPMVAPMPLSLALRMLPALIRHCKPHPMPEALVNGALIASAFPANRADTSRNVAP